jgi:HAMP domain-containing protein
MKRLAAVLAGVVIVETAFLVFVLTAYNQRIDRIERAVNAVSAGNPSPLAKRRDAVLTARF